jgi:16S rRNA (uracil1498-N3)-methyltransferase
MKRDKEQSEGADLEEPGGKLRLFVSDALGAGARVIPHTGQTHYLLHVMRAREGDFVRVFNGRDGEWRAVVSDVTKRGCILVCDNALRAQDRVPDLWLAFAPIKKTPADYVAQKATELGVSVMQPVMTRRTVASRVNLERLAANAAEAAEQSERLSVPEMRAPVSLNALLGSWPNDRVLVFCDEGGEAEPIAAALEKKRGAQSWAVLTGPEGGFDPDERTLIRAASFVLPVTLGPRIMRADTAALAALAVWQAVIGDWK